MDNSRALVNDLFMKENETQIQELTESLFMIQEFLDQQLFFFHFLFSSRMPGLWNKKVRDISYESKV